ncbi:MAG: myosin heavy subunit, partial [Candidatus Omnitrophota bacterium]
MNNNKSGKVLVIFLVIIAILLTSLTAISIFFFQKEIEKRKFTETMLTRSQESEVQLEGSLKEAKDSMFVLQEKNKEADERVNGLLDDIELGEGLRAELKIENNELKEKLKTEQKGKAKLKEKLSKDLESAEIELNDMKEALDKVMNENDVLKGKQGKLSKDLKTATEKVDQLVRDIESIEDFKDEEEIKNSEKSMEVDLEVDSVEVDESKRKSAKKEPEIIPGEIPNGRVLSVDNDTEFVIVNLG